jgi:tetratricopeptide (TPR) repeat protein
MEECPVPAPGENLRIDGTRLWDSLMEMAKIGPGVAGGNNRQTLTDADGEGRALFRRLAEDAGCTVGVDAMGTMFAERPGQDPDALPVYVGSHLDTQPTGGRYDGVNNLGLVLKDQGDLAGARDAYERALAIDEAVFGPDHPKVATDVNNLGLVLQDQGDLTGARAAFERALAIDEAVFGPDHPNVARDVNNLGLVLQDQGDLAGARTAYERALAIDEAVFGPDHPEVARDVNNLGR